MEKRSEMDSSSSEEIIVRLEMWSEEYMALLCGIANAGGGSVIITSTERRHTRRMREYRKSFESIPSRTRQALGIACTTEPLMDGTELCLEIRIPAARFPIDFQGDYFYYDEGRNEQVDRSFFDLHAQLSNDEAQKDRPPSEQPNENDSEAPHDSRSVVRANRDARNARSPTFKDRSIAAANRLDLTSTDEYVLKVIETNGRVTAPRIAEVLGVSESTVRRSFRKLRELELIERIGSNKAGYWRSID